MLTDLRTKNSLMRYYMDRSRWKRVSRTLCSRRKRSSKHLSISKGREVLEFLVYPIKASQIISQCRNRSKGSTILSVKKNSTTSNASITEITTSLPTSLSTRYRRSTPISPGQTSSSKSNARIYMSARSESHRLKAKVSLGVKDDFDYGMNYRI